jgi:hypothetical protein
MGIQDRDYMKRPPDDDRRRGSSSGSDAEDRLSRFLEKHPRFFLYVGIGLGVLLLITLAVVVASKGNSP